MNGMIATTLARSAYARRSEDVSAMAGMGKICIRVHTLSAIATVPIAAPTATIFCSVLIWTFPTVGT